MRLNQVRVKCTNCERAFSLLLLIWIVYDVNSFCCVLLHFSYVSVRVCFIWCKCCTLFCCSAIQNAFSFHFGEPLDVLLLVQRVSLKRIYFWNSVQNDDDGEQNATIWKMEKKEISMGTSENASSLVFVRAFGAYSLARYIYVYSMCLSVCFVCWAFFALPISFCFCHRVRCSKINYPFFSAVHAILVLCALFLLRWIAHKMIFSEFSWATAICVWIVDMCAYSVHIKHFANPIHVTKLIGIFIFIPGHSFSFTSCATNIVHIYASLNFIRYTHKFPFATFFSNKPWLRWPTIRHFETKNKSKEPK